VHRISQSRPTPPSGIENASVSAKPLLCTPTAEQLRFVVSLEAGEAQKTVPVISNVSLTDDRGRRYLYPVSTIGGLNEWEKEVLDVKPPQDNKTSLVVLAFAAAMPEERRLDFFRLKFTARLERAGKRRSRITTEYPFDIEIRKGQIEKLRMFNLLPRTAGAADALARLKAHVRHFRRDLVGSVYVHLISIWGLLGSIVIVAIFTRLLERRKQKARNGASNYWSEDDFEFESMPSRMKHYRLGIALFLLLVAAIGGIMLLANSFSRRDSAVITQNQPVIVSTPWVTPTVVPPPTPEPTPTPIYPTWRVPYKGDYVEYINGWVPVTGYDFTHIDADMESRYFASTHNLHIERMPKSLARRFAVEIHFPDRSYSIALPLRVMWYSPNGSLIPGCSGTLYVAKQGIFGQKDFGRTCGYDQPDQWPVGKYRVEMWDNETLVAQKELEIYDDTIRVDTGRM
jgi:hypothetical protein